MHIHVHSCCSYEYRFFTNRYEQKNTSSIDDRTTECSHNPANQKPTSSCTIRDSKGSKAIRKSEQTVASNKRRRAEKKAQTKATGDGMITDAIRMLKIMVQS